MCVSAQMVTAYAAVAPRYQAWQDANRGGMLFTAPGGTMGSSNYPYYNMTDHGMNDKISSIQNYQSGYLYAYQDIDMKGWRLTVKANQYMSDLRNYPADNGSATNDRISSMW